MNTGLSVGTESCPKCKLPEPPLWFEQPMNETIREYARNYIAPVKIFYKDFDEAAKVWGTEGYNEGSKGS